MKNLIHKNKIFFGIIVFLILLTIPLTIIQVQTQQNLKQQAAAEITIGFGNQLNYVVEVGKVVNIGISINNPDNKDVSAVDFTLTYDSSALTLTDFLPEGTFEPIINDNQPGTLRYVGANPTIDTTRTTSTTVLVGTLHFLGKNIPSVPRFVEFTPNISQITVSDQASSISLSRQSATVTVVAAGTAPTATPVPGGPTATPTPIPTSTIRLDSLVPSSGNTESNITLTGNGFGTSPGFVIFLTSSNTQYGAPIVSWTNQQIIATVPGLLTSNQSNQQVFVRTSNNIESNKLTYQILQGQPRIDSLTPLDVLPGGQLTISGEGMGSNQGKILFYKSYPTLSGTGQIVTWADNLVKLIIPLSLTSNTEYGIQVETSGNTHSSFKYYTLGTVPNLTLTPTGIAPTATLAPGDTIMQFIGPVTNIFTDKNGLLISRKNQDLTVYFYKSTDNPAIDPTGNNSNYKKTVSLSFNNSQFSAPNMNLGKIDAGTYKVLIKSPKYLRKIITTRNILSTGNNTFTFPAGITLADGIGDINDDNILDIIDYNIIASCFTIKANTASCISKGDVDLNDDDEIDQIDYNLFLKSLSFTSRKGD